MSYPTANFNFGSNYEVTAQKPLDNRLRTPTFSQLTSNPWTAYKGMLCYVTDDTDATKNGLYALTDMPSDVSGNWEKIGSGGSSSGSSGSTVSTGLEINTGDTLGGFLKVTNNNNTDGMFFGIDGAGQGVVSNTKSDEPLHLKTDNTTRLAISNTGDVGIGIDSPANGAKLHIYDDATYSAGSSTAVFLGWQGATNRSGIIKYFQGSGPGSGTSGQADAAAGDVAGRLWFGHWGEDADGGSQSLNILYDYPYFDGTALKGGRSRVGIGTKTPRSALHVVGDIAKYTTIGTPTGIHMGDYGNSINILMVPRHPDAASNLEFARANQITMGRVRYNHHKNTMEFWTGNKKNFYINNNGSFTVETTGKSTGIARTEFHNEDNPQGDGIFSINDVFAHNPDWPESQHLNLGVNYINTDPSGNKRKYSFIQSSVHDLDDNVVVKHSDLALNPLGGNVCIGTDTSLHGSHVTNTYSIHGLNNGLYVKGGIVCNGSLRIPYSQTNQGIYMEITKNTIRSYSSQGLTLISSANATYEGLVFQNHYGTKNRTWGYISRDGIFTLGGTGLEGECTRDPTNNRLIQGPERFNVTGNSSFEGDIYVSGDIIKNGVTLSSGDVVLALPDYQKDSDVTCHFGRAAIGKMGTWTDGAGFAHLDCATQLSYALEQSYVGDTFLNCKDGRRIYIKSNNQNWGAFAGGKLGIGTHQPEKTLHVLGTGFFSEDLFVNTCRIGRHDSTGDGWACFGWGDFAAGGALNEKTYGQSRAGMVQAKNGTTRIQAGGFSGAFQSIFFRAGNATRMIIKDSGNVGIGTGETISQKLVVRVTGGGSGLSTDGGYFRIEDDVQNNKQILNIGVNSAGLYSYIQSTQEGVDDKKLALNPRGGRVVIGDTDATNQFTLQVNGTGTGMDSDIGQFMIREPATDPATEKPIYLKIGVNSANKYSYIQSTHAHEGQTTLSLNPLGGNVGIGTTSPLDKLDVNGNIRLGSWENTSRFIGFSGLGGGEILAGMEIESVTAVGNYSQNIHLHTHHHSTTHGPRLTVRYDGNVGIGTTTPAELLHIEGGNIRIKNSHTVTINSDKIEKTGNSSYTIGTIHNQSLNFKTSNSTRMTIEGNGNVGIGVTDPTRKLEIGGDTSITTGRLYCRYDENVVSFIGRSAVGYCGHNDFATFAHVDMNTTTDYAFAQNNTGSSIMNAKGGAGNILSFRFGHAYEKMKVTSGGEVWVGHNGGKLFVGDSVNHTTNNPLGQISNGLEKVNIYAGTLKIDKQMTFEDLFNPASGYMRGQINIYSHNYITGSSGHRDTMMLSIGAYNTTSDDVNFGQNTSYSHAGRTEGSIIQSGLHNASGHLTFNDALLFLQPRGGQTIIGDSINHESKIIDTMVPSDVYFEKHTDTNKLVYARQTPLQVAGRRMLLSGMNAVYMAHAHKSGNSYQCGLSMKLGRHTDPDGQFTWEILHWIGTGSVGAEGRNRLVFKDNDGHYRFQFKQTGKFNCTSVVSSSDDRAKHNEVVLTGCCETISKLTPKKYIKTDIKDASGNFYPSNHNFDVIPDNAQYESGFIAQEISGNIPELGFIVDGGEEDPSGNPVAMGVNYTCLHAYEVGAIQELLKRVEYLEEEVARLKGN